MIQRPIQCTYNSSIAHENIQSPVHFLVAIECRHKLIDRLQIAQIHPNDDQIVFVLGAHRLCNVLLRGL